MILGLLLLAQAPKLWSPKVERLMLEYRFVIRGSAQVDHFDYRVDREVSGRIFLDERTTGEFPRVRLKPASAKQFVNWTFTLNPSPETPDHLQTTLARVRVADRLLDGGRVIQEYRADHAARPVLTEAMVDLDPVGRTYDVLFGIGDTLGARDAVRIDYAGPIPSTTCGLTELPYFKSAGDEISQTTLRLPMLRGAVIEKSWPAAQLVGPWKTFKNRDVRLIIWARIADP